LTSRPFLPAPRKTALPTLPKAQALKKAMTSFLGSDNAT
jgi:hypothetical protein